VQQFYAVYFNSFSGDASRPIIEANLS